MYQSISPRYSASGTTSRVPAAENQSLVGFKPGYAHKTVLGKVEILRKVLGRTWSSRAGLTARRSIRDTGRQSGARCRSLARQTLRTAMTTAVQQRVNGSLVVAHHNHRHLPMFRETKSPGLGISVSCARNIQVRSNIRSISSRHTSSLTKISRLTSPRWTSTQPGLDEAWSLRRHAFTL